MHDAKTSLKDSSPGHVAGHSKQQRAHATREQVVEAARVIFARDGFELARLEDIATQAGKTRGAVYTHFRDKEDLFFAIFEDDKSRDFETMRRALATVSTRDEKIEILVQHIVHVMSDRRRMLLNLEFKMYAIRHPHKQKRLADLVSTMCVRISETGINELFPELIHPDPEMQRVQAGQFGALIDGLALDHFFDPDGLDGKTLLRQLRAGVAYILDRTPIQRHA